MLLSLTVNNFAIAEHLNVDFNEGMTAITGETGAGKSIALDALGLALGSRGDASMIKHGADKADIHALFDISQLPLIQLWLSEHELQDGDNQECLLRRVISAEGRSRAFINSKPCNLSILSELGSQLVDIHSQHAHHQLMKKEHHQHLLDAFTQAPDLIEKTCQQFSNWQKTLKTIKKLNDSNDAADTRKDYLQFQLNEFEDLAASVGEYEKLEAEHKQIANAQSITEACQYSLSLCREGDENIHRMLSQTLSSLAPLSANNDSLKEAEDLLQSALIQVEEAAHSIRDAADSIGSAADLPILEARLGQFHDLARKHKVQPQDLLEHQASLQTELDSIVNADQNLERLEAEASEQEAAFHKTASQLSKKRATAAKKLSKAIHEKLSLLGMQHCSFQCELNTNTDKPSSLGHDAAEFLVSTNPGQPAQALQKIASGGELSRISLAIQVITATSSTIPTLVFDEVDVGIGGATAEVVGSLLRELGGNAQIISVTHQAQVASKAHQHYLVEKKVSKKASNTDMQPLTQDQRIEEIARMLGGIDITDATLKHAKEMLTLS